MATSNFRPMDYDMPLVCGGMADYDDCVEFEIELDFARELAETFTENLTYHNITVLGGYYEGFQFFVAEKYADYFDMDRNSPYCIENDDAWYYFDLCRSRALRAADAEKRKIRKWLENQAERGFTMMVPVGRFSNGLTVYKNI